MEGDTTSKTIPTSFCAPSHVPAGDEALAVERPGSDARSRSSIARPARPATARHVPAAVQPALTPSLLLLCLLVSGCCLVAVWGVAGCAAQQEDSPPHTHRRPTAFAAHQQPLHPAFSNLPLALGQALSHQARCLTLLAALGEDVRVHACAAWVCVRNQTPSRRIQSCGTVHMRACSADLVPVVGIA